MSTVAEPMPSSRWPYESNARIFSRSNLRRHHRTVALALAAYGVAFTLWAVLRPFGADDIRFLAVEDIASVLPPMLAGALALMASRRSITTRPRLGWRLLSLGWFSWGAGEAIWAIYEVGFRVETPFPSPADIGYLALIPFVFAGSTVLMPRRQQLYRLADIVNIVSTALIGVAVVGYFVLYEIMAQSDVDLLEKLLAAAYPLGDIFLLSVIASAFQRAWRGASGVVLGSLFLGCLCFLVADLAFAELDLHDEYASGEVITDAGWVISFLAVAYAAWLQTIWAPSYQTVLEAPQPASWHRIPLTGVFVILLVIAVAVSFGVDSPLGRAGVLIVIGAAAFVTMLRQLLLSLAQNIHIVHQTSRELSSAAKMQSSLLPAPTHNGASYELAASYVPARHVGGDFYEWWEDPPSILHIAVGDVMGKGMGAALLTSGLRSALRGSAGGRNVRDSVLMASLVMEPAFNRASAFSTLFYGQLDFTTNTLTYADCGHGLAFIVMRDGDVANLNALSMPLGMLDFGTSIESSEVRLEPGDAVFVCSDGLLELMPEIVEPRTLSRLLRKPEPVAVAVGDIVTASLGSGLPADDLTAIAVRLNV